MPDHAPGELPGLALPELFEFALPGGKSRGAACRPPALRGDDATRSSGLYFNCVRLRPPLLSSARFPSHSQQLQCAPCIRSDPPSQMIARRSLTSSISDTFPTAHSQRTKKQKH